MESCNIFVRYLIGSVDRTRGLTHSVGIMGAPSLAVNWNEVRSLAESGKLLKEVADLFEISYEAVKKRAAREKWLSPSAVQAAVKRHALLSPIVPMGSKLAEIVANEPEKLRNHHTERTRRILNAMWKQVELSPPPIETVGDMEKADKMTRLNEGMTTGEPQAVMQVLLGSQSDIGPSHVSQCVEVEDVGEFGEVGDED